MTTLIRRLAFVMLQPKCAKLHDAVNVLLMIMRFLLFVILCYARCCIGNAFCSQKAELGFTGDLHRSCTNLKAVAAV